MPKPRSTRKKQPKLPPVPPGFREIAIFEPGPEAIELPLAEQLENSISRQVAAGYLDDPKLLTDVIQSFEDQASRQTIRKLSKPLLAQARTNHARLQKAWPKTTDCDRLDRAFAALERLGVVARQDFLCCSNCGGLAIFDEMKKTAKRKTKVLGYTYFHAQSTESAVEGRGLYLEYGSIERDRATSLQIGRTVLKALKEAGLKPVWNGRFDTHIRVPMKWRRRSIF